MRDHHDISLLTSGTTHSPITSKRALLLLATPSINLQIGSTRGTVRAQIQETPSGVFCIWAAQVVPCGTSVRESKSLNIAQQAFGEVSYEDCTVRVTNDYPDSRPTVLATYFSMYKIRDLELFLVLCPFDFVLY